MFIRLSNCLRDSLSGKSERLNGKYEKDLQEIRAQLTKANKEAESQKKDSKRSKGLKLLLLHSWTILFPRSYHIML